MDATTKKIKIGMHIIFDEAGYTIPPAARTIFQQGYNSKKSQPQY